MNELVELPFWVPSNGRSLAAVMTSPEEPQRLVVLLQVGGGVPRSHRNRAWVYVARQLGARGVASIRTDYPGTGDSTGDRAASLDRPPVDAVGAVVDVAWRASGARSVGVVGQCLGVRTAIQLTRQVEACDRVVLSMPVTLRPAMGGPGGPGMRWVRRAVAGRMRRAKRIVRRQWDRIDLRRGAELDPAIAEIARRADVLFLHGGTAESRQWLRARAAELSATSDHRVEVWDLPTVGVAGFRALDVQAATRAAVVEWFTSA